MTTVSIPTSTVAVADSGVDVALTIGAATTTVTATGGAGPANSLAIGSVTAGTAAAATITGTPPSQTLDLTLPGAAWGNITGTLADQTDLDSALAGKAPLASPTFTGTVTIPDVSLGEWTAYTPTIGGWTVGDGTVTGRYARVGKIVLCEATFVLGSTSSASGSPLTFSVPVALRDNGTFLLNGRATYLDASVAARYSAALLPVSGVLRVYTVGANGAIALPTTTAPFTWVATDTVHIRAIYEAS